MATVSRGRWCPPTAGCGWSIVPAPAGARASRPNTKVRCLCADVTMCNNTKCDDVISMSNDIITCTYNVLGSNILVASKSVVYDL